MDISKSDEQVAEMIREALGCSTEEFSKRYSEYKKAEESFKEVYEPFKEKLLGLYKNQMISDKSLLIDNGLKLIYVSPGTRSSIDSKKLKEEEPEIAKRFTKLTDVSATIRIDGV